LRVDNEQLLLEELGRFQRSSCNIDARKGGLESLFDLNLVIPEGIDIYYDNVGGEQLEPAITAMNNWGRISMSVFYLLKHTDWLMYLLVA
jgi:NADPH-dependent curcumin reductase CurA